MRNLPWLLCGVLALAVSGCGDDGDDRGSGSGGSQTGGATEGTDSTTTEGTETSGMTAGSDGSASNSGTESTTSAGSETSSASDTETSAGTEGTGAATTGGEGMSLLEVQGTYGTDAFDYSCDFTDPLYSNLMCDGGRWFATCRPNPTALGAIDIFQVWVSLDASDATMGDKDYLDANFGITMGDATAQTQPLSPLSLNAATNTVTIDADAMALGPISGALSATWVADSNGPAGSITGTFSFVCPN